MCELFEIGWRYLFYRFCFHFLLAWRCSLFLFSLLIIVWGLGYEMHLHLLLDDVEADNEIACIVTVLRMIEAREDSRRSVQTCSTSNNGIPYSSTGVSGPDSFAVTIPA